MPTVTHVEPHVPTAWLTLSDRSHAAASSAVRSVASALVKRVGWDDAAPSGEEDAKRDLRQKS